jgi:hypothetical protein
LPAATSPTRISKRRPSWCEESPLGRPTRPLQRVAKQG